jgi:xanthine/uracil/vitamin C permease (AzgA family)
MNLKLGIAAGIGLFLALIGLQNAGIVADDPVTLVTLGNLFRSRKPSSPRPGSCSSPGWLEGEGEPVTQALVTPRPGRY